MWRRSLHSHILIWLMLCAIPSGAQSPLCDDKNALDSAIAYVSRHYSPADPAWMQACDSLLYICPDHDALWGLKAIPAASAGDWQDCFSSLAHAIWINPREWLPYQASLKCLFAKDYRGALSDLRRSDTFKRQHWLVNGHTRDFYRGLCHLGLNDLSTASEYFRRDLDSQLRHGGPEVEHHVSLFFAGLCHHLRGNQDDAEALLRRCMKRAPEYPEPAYYLGLVLSAQGRDADAQDAFKEARERLRLRPSRKKREGWENYINYPYSIALREVEGRIAGDGR